MCFIGIFMLEFADKQKPREKGYSDSKVDEALYVESC